MTKSSLLLAVSLFALPVFADEGKAAAPAIKEIQQNDRVRVAEVTFKPGNVSPSAKRPMRVVHTLKGGSLERTFEDGTKEAVQWKTGETKILTEERPYAIKNVGKGDVRLLVVYLK